MGYMTERKEELANAFIHGLGIILFVVLAPILVGYAYRNLKETWPVIVYASCLLLMYMNSTFYHSATGQSTIGESTIGDTSQLST
jgi:channel protein (hemolysin III family)